MVRVGLFTQYLLRTEDRGASPDSTRISVPINSYVKHRNYVVDGAFE